MHYFSNDAEAKHSGWHWVAENDNNANDDDDDYEWLKWIGERELNGSSRTILWRSTYWVQEVEKRVHSWPDIQYA